MLERINIIQGNIYLKAENGKEAASKARVCPRVKHDHKDAILSVTELDYETFQELWEENENISYFSCYNNTGTERLSL